MHKEVIVWPDNRLRKKAEEVTEFDEKLVQLVVDLHTTMEKFNSKPHMPDAAGLAAPQLGVFKRVFVYKLDGQPTCMINPVILEKEGEQYEPEGCLSFPGVFVKVNRPNKITVEFQDVDGNKNQLKTDGFVSRCIQHEIDHLNGVTFLHALSQIKRDLVTRKMKKVKKRFDEQRKQYEKWAREQQREAAQVAAREESETAGSGEGRVEGEVPPSE